MVVFIIRIYQVLLSPFLGFGKCRFIPTCSEYAKQAVERYGVLTGLRMAFARVLKCRPGGGCGFDPVPEKIKRKGE